jgi:hypothetical protein
MSPPHDATASVIPIENLADWRGQDVLDLDGEKLGSLEHVLYDAEVDKPAFIAVKSGTLGKRLTLVPLRGATVGRTYVRVAGGKAGFKDAPSFPPGTELTAEDEQRVYGYFKFDYAPAGQGARRLARR